MQDVHKLWGQRRDRKDVKTTVYKYRDVSLFFTHEEWPISSGHYEERVDALERGFVFDEGGVGAAHDLGCTAL